MASPKKPRRKTASAQWWICGPIAYTLPVIPAKAPEGLGFVYAILFSNSTIKIGQSNVPRCRIKSIASHVAIYGEVHAEMIAVSHPRPDYKLLERRLHDHFAEKRIRGELFQTFLCNVSQAIADPKVLSPRLPIARTGSTSGRPPRPWYWAERRCWATNINGKRYRLGKTEEEANAAFADLLKQT